ncbi:MAG TPA: hypothetical protein VGJ64_02600 [Gemmatimonadaceae bacterium]|jgi:hypothetical protein
MTEGEVFQDPNASFGMIASMSDPGKRRGHAKTGIEILKNFPFRHGCQQIAYYVVATSKGLELGAY